MRNVAIFFLFFIFTFMVLYFTFDSQKHFHMVSQPFSTIFKKIETRKELIRRFRKICEKSGTDKLTHRYYTLYGTHLGPIRHEPLNFLEIGLGCSMSYGPGKSLLAWREYLTNPNTNISYLEYDRKCAEEFLPPRVHKMFIGDQSDFEFLEKVGKEGGPFDFIVDDGGHKRTYQVNSFLGLWPHVKPHGGVYVIEDLHFTFWKECINSNYSGLDMIQDFLLLFNHADFKADHRSPINKTFNPRLMKVYNSISSINCYLRACVFVKA